MKRLFLQILTWGVPLLITLGIFKISLFYRFFNLPITNFLDLSEVVILFSNDIVLYFSVVLISYALAYWKSTNQMEMNFKRFVLHYFQKSLFAERLYLYLKRYRFWPITLILGFLGGVVSEYSKWKISLTFFGLFFSQLFTLSMLIVSLEINRKLWIKNGLQKSEEATERLFLFLIRLIAIVAFYTCIEVQKVKYEHKYINTSALIDEKLFKSDSLNFIIGNTNSYLFIYSSTEDNTRVIPMSRIKEISFGNIYYLGKPKK